MKEKLNTQKWQEEEECTEAALTIGAYLIETGRGHIVDELGYGSSIADKLSDYNYTPISINCEQWELLQSYLSCDLSNDDKKAISDFIALAVIFHNLAVEQPKLNYAKLRDELIEFKEVMFDLMPIGESHHNRDNIRYVLSVDVQETMRNTYKALSRDALSHLKYAFWLMWHTDAFYNPLATVRPTTYPSQYYCAATVALERLSQQSKDETGFYRSIFKLWWDLGETDFKATCNEEYDPPQISPLVGFTYTLFSIISELTNTRINKIGSIRKDLAKYRKIIGI